MYVRAERKGEFTSGLKSPKISRWQCPLLLQKQHWIVREITKFHSLRPSSPPKAASIESAKGAKLAIAKANQ